MKNASVICGRVLSLLLLIPSGGRAQAQPEGQASTCPDVTVVTTKLDSATKTLQDWPNLARYRDANTQVAEPAKKEVRVVFMGDSITDAWVRPQFGGFFPGKPYVDRGISGQTTPQMVLRMQPDVIALRPDVM